MNYGFILRRGTEHVFDKYSVTARGVVDKHVGYSANQLSVLHYGRAAHPLHDTARCF